MEGLDSSVGLRGISGTGLLFRWGFGDGLRKLKGFRAEGLDFGILRVEGSKASQSGKATYNPNAAQKDELITRTLGRSVLKATADAS